MLSEYRNALPRKPPLVLGYHDIFAVPSSRVDHLVSWFLGFRVEYIERLSEVMERIEHLARRYPLPKRRA